VAHDYSLIFLLLSSNHAYPVPVPGNTGKVGEDSVNPMGKGKGKTSPLVVVGSTLKHGKPVKYLLIINS
jgi:hypothetical protein